MKNSEDWFFRTNDVLDPAALEKIKQSSTKPQRHVNTDGSVPIYDKQGKVICVVQATTEKKPFTPINDFSDPSRDRNARLISVAPMMLGMLKSLAHEYKKLDMPTDDISVMLEMLEYVDGQ